MVALGTAVHHNFRRTLLVPSREKNISSLGAAVQHNFRRTLLVPSREKNISSLGAALRYSITSGTRCWCHLWRKLSRAYQYPGRRGTARSVARPKSFTMKSTMQGSNDSHLPAPIGLSTQDAKRSTRGYNGTRRGCNCTHCTRLATGLTYLKVN